MPADMTFFDLEDSVAPSEKVAARQKVAHAIRDMTWDERVLGVRVNGWTSPWVISDVEEVLTHCGPRLDIVMMPKVESPDDVIAMDELLTTLEEQAGLVVGHLGLECQIESARGLMNVDAICEASPRLESIVLGPADLAASLGLPITTIDEALYLNPFSPLTYAFARLLVAGRANGLNVIDGPYLKVRDMEGLRSVAQLTANYGFDGKWALTPDQVPVLNDVFTPDQLLFDKSWDILEAYDQAANIEGRGATMLGDDMIDEASVKVALSVVSRGERSGLRRGSPPKKPD